MEGTPLGKEPESTHKKKIKIPEDELNALKEKAIKADEYFDKLLRLQADFENYKKRLDREKVDFIKYANEGLIVGLLNILDDFERAIDSAKNSNDSKTLLQGVEMIRQHFQEALEERGLNKIDPKGESFNPEKHEAVMHIETDEYPENTVVEVLRKGYGLNGKILRPAVVKVAKKKSEEKKEEV
ncbi:MAG: nucleotide exchange factor GrpE [Candidatus Omnitrophota bacterium]